MLIKFEAKTARVKGASFHPKRPWILASLHSGIIILWDYQLNNCLDKYEGHDGPVRGLDFHYDQPLFVSGGDDYLIKVWNYQQRRCLFTFIGHVDYVRTTFFHPNHPWILSASDDQTIRIWNWQSRCNIALLTGHNHYVMCAKFHPTENLVVSASLDQSIRVWDISGVTKRHTTAKPPPLDKSGRRIVNVDLFSETDYTSRFIVEGHDKGVNWATFHPNLPLILSGGDDRTVKLWRMGENKIWEVDTFRGHYNNVSGVLFDPFQSVVISVSEDKSVRVWDMTRRTSLQIYRRAHCRFWVVAAHPNKRLFCAGHDSGLMVFKLERERPVWTVHQNILFYVKEKYLRRSDLSTGQDVSIMRLKVEGRANYSSMSYNPVENCILLSNYDSSFELYMIPAERDISLPPDSPRDWKKSTGRSACCLGRNRFAVLLNENHILIKTTKNEIHKKVQIPFNCLNLFPAGAGMVLIQQQPNPVDLEKGGASTIVLFDVQLKKVVAKVKTICNIKHVVWSTDRSRLALVGKSGIMMCNKKLEVFASCMETLGKIKSGAWREPMSEVGVFVYNTYSHLKYVLTNGDTGCIRTLDVPIYMVSITNDEVLCFDRSAKPHRFKMDISEPLFKLALITGDYNQVSEMIRSCKLVGQAIISYLHRKGYPEIALHFLQKQDERTRFNLALECCNVEVALECARILDKVPVWNKLAEMSLLLGNHQIVELCYQRTRNIPKLAFLYLITGKEEKLKKLLRTSTAQGSPLSWQYWMALVGGDVESQIKILGNFGGGKMLMAYQMAVGLQLENVASDMKSNMTPELIENIGKAETGSYRPFNLPIPLFEQNENWPLLMVSKSVFGTTLSSSLFKSKSQDNLVLESAASGAWAEADEEFSEVNDGLLKSDENAGGGWDDHADIALPSTSTSSTKLDVESCDMSFSSVPTKGTSVPEKWCNAFRLPVVHILSGKFESAARVLHDQLGIVNISPFRDLFLNIYQNSHLMFTLLPNTPGLCMYPEMQGSGNKEQSLLPQACEAVTLDILVNVKLKSCYELVTKGQFLDARDSFRALLLNIPLVIVKTRAEITKAQELISLCKEYILGLQMEMYRKTFSKAESQDQKRSLELAAYFTHFMLDNRHLMLTLRTAMNLSYKIGYFKNAFGFARRLLELGPSSDLVIQARKLLKASENKSNVSSVELEYDEQNPFSVCAETYKPIYRGKEDVKCSFCGASYFPEFKGKLCKVCSVAEVGKVASGLKISLIQLR